MISITSPIYASLSMTPVSQGLVFVRAHVCSLWVHPLRLVCVLEPQRGAPSNPGSTLVHRRTRVPLSPTNRWGVNTDQDGVQLADARALVLYGVCGGASSEGRVRHVPVMPSATAAGPQEAVRAGGTGDVQAQPCGAGGVDVDWPPLSASQQEEMDDAIMMFQEVMDQVSGWRAVEGPRLRRLAWRASAREAPM